MSSAASHPSGIDARRGSVLKLVWRLPKVHATALLLIAGDALLLAANLIFLTVDEPLREPTHPVFSDLRWNGDNDGSYLEFFGQLQLVAAIIMLIFIRRSTRVHLYAAWAAALTWIFADDILNLHEKGGELFVALGVPGTSGLGAQDLGELAVWAAVGLVLLCALIPAHLKAPAGARVDSWVLFGLTAVLAVFAAGVDMVKVVVADSISSFELTALALLETAGELGAITLMTVAILVMTVRISALERPAD